MWLHTRTNNIQALRHSLPHTCGAGLNLCPMEFSMRPCWYSKYQARGAAPVPAHKHACSHTHTHKHTVSAETNTAHVIRPVWCMSTHFMSPCRRRSPVYSFSLSKDWIHSSKAAFTEKGTEFVQGQSLKLLDVLVLCIMGLWNAVMRQQQYQGLLLTVTMMHWCDTSRYVYSV